MSEGDADVALHRAVGEIALEAGLHEGRGEHVEEGVADLEVGLGVLEADRIDLVWHRARPDGALAAHLGEIAHRDVGPEVGAHVVQHPVEAGDVGIELGLPVVALDLGGQGVPGQAQALDEGFADVLPVGPRHGGQVGSIGAGRAVELAEELGILDPPQLSLQPPGEHREFLAHRRRRRRLAVGVGEQGHVAQVAGHRCELLDQRGRSWEPHVLDGALHHEGVGQVVDVLAGAAEVDQLGQATVLVSRGDRREPLLEEILDRLDVVLGDSLGAGHLLDLLGAELVDNGAQPRLLVAGEAAHTGHDLPVGEVDEPLDLDLDPGPVEGRLRQVIHEGGHDPAVASIEGTERDRRVEVSEGSHGPHSPRASSSLLTWATMPGSAAAISP